MSHVAAARLAYAHPGGELLFSDVSFRVSPGEHVGVVGSNGGGKRTLFRTLSGGERKRLVLDVLFASDAELLLLDEPDNFLDVPAKLALERQIRGTKKTIVLISHDREVLSGAVGSILTLEGSGAWIHGGPYGS